MFSFPFTKLSAEESIWHLLVWAKQLPTLSTNYYTDFTQIDDTGAL